MAIAAGKLRHRVLFQRLVGAEDALGQPVNSWVDVAPLWSDIKTMNGVQTIKADKPSAKVEASIRVRYTTAIEVGMRGVCKGAIYKVIAILPSDAAQGFTDLVCEVIT